MGTGPPVLKCISRPEFRLTMRVTSILPTTPIAASARSLRRPVSSPRSLALDNRDTVAMAERLQPPSYTLPSL
jgi:hypothetical protein